MNDSDKDLVERARRAAKRFKLVKVTHDVEELVSWLYSGQEVVPDARHDLRLIASMGGVPKEEVKKAHWEGVQDCLVAVADDPVGWNHETLYEASRAKRVADGNEDSMTKE